jgi:hypothetical protein
MFLSVDIGNLDMIVILSLLMRICVVIYCRIRGVGKEVLSVIFVVLLHHG